MKFLRILLFVFACTIIFTTNAQVQFEDDFETGDLASWYFQPEGNNTYNERTATEEIAAISGTYSCKLDGSSNHYGGITGNFADSQPTEISVMMRSENVQDASGYFVVGKANPDNMFNPHILFAFFTNGNLRILGLGSTVYTQPALNNTWYKVDFKNIDFTSKTYDVYVDDVLVASSFPFRVSMDSVNKVFLYNFNDNVSYYDDVLIIQEATCSNEITSGPVPIYTGTGDADSECATLVTYDQVTVDSFEFDNSCSSVTLESVEQIGGLGTGSVFPVGVTTEEFLLTATTGETYTYSFDVTVEDTTVPSIDCPEDYIVGAENGVYVIPDFSTNVQDNCSSANELNIVQSPAPGTVIAEGDSVEVLLEAQDSSENLTTCTFLITVDSSLSIGSSEESILTSIYPNPANDYVVVDAGHNTISDVEIYDLIGKLVLKRTLNNQKGSIDLSSFPAGTYFLAIESNAGRTVEKLIVR